MKWLTGMLCAASLLACNREGVCVAEAKDTTICSPATQRLCGKRDGKWHAYEGTDGDLGLANGKLTCKKLGFTESAGQRDWKRPE